MRLPKRSPFLHSRQADLFEIYRHLYPESAYLSSTASTPRDRHKALSTIQLWLNRSACPFAVETTAALVQSILLDQHMQQFAASSSSDPSLDLQYALDQMGGAAELGIRVNYSMAIIRFVNSIVDSYQTGGFAQSIAAIAARIGLPQWFVDLRHAATHEELPSLAVCREAARSALEWLHRHFWIPQLFTDPNSQFYDPASDQDTAQWSGELPVAPSESEHTPSEEDQENVKAVTELRLALKAYRDLAKQVVRDRSKMGASKDEFRKHLRRINAFVHKRRAAHPAFADQLLNSGGARKRKIDEDASVPLSSMEPDEVDECTRSALLQLVNELIQPGGIIPLSRSKRTPASATGKAITLPTEVFEIWSTLLAHLSDTFGRIFGLLLIEELLQAVNFESASDDKTSRDIEHEEQAVRGISSAEAVDDELAWKEKAFANASYRKTANAWIRQLVTVAPSTLAASAAAVTSISTGTSAAKANRSRLVTEGDVVERCLLRHTSESNELLRFLCRRDSNLHERVGALLQVLETFDFLHKTDSLPFAEQIRGADVDEMGMSGFEGQLDVMDTRLQQIRSLEPVWAAQHQHQRTHLRNDRVAMRVDKNAQRARSIAGSGMPFGWSLAPKDWTPTPLGCLNGRTPDLYLEI
ncbi:Las1-domain-containing protein [Testicularia cyperi]|uniref:Las1-domain-containing protein n=1 Tax=Testicularia cyperi TaxID=1882483 RepID=A0A317XTM5_9BASI|nr:Las1-domain-containing protein [Testicularia cyperi]